MCRIKSQKKLLPESGLWVFNKFFQTDSTRKLVLLCASEAELQTERDSESWNRKTKELWLTKRSRTGLEFKLKINKSTKTLWSSLSVKETTKSLTEFIKYTWIRIQHADKFKKPILLECVGLSHQSCDNRKVSWVHLHGWSRSPELHSGLQSPL